jgi:hypothetical protein
MNNGLLKRVRRCGLVSTNLSNVWFLLFVKIGCILLLHSTTHRLGAQIRKQHNTDTLNGFCAIFEPCKELEGFEVLSCKHHSNDSAGAERSTKGLWALAIVHYDNEAIVETAKVGLFMQHSSLSIDSVVRCQLDNIQRYFDDHVVGKKVRREALSFIGGRPKSGSFDDGFMANDSVVVAGDVIWRGHQPGSLLISMYFGSPRHAMYEAKSSMIEIRVR